MHLVTQGGEADTNCPHCEWTVILALCNVCVSCSLHHYGPPLSCEIILTLNDNKQTDLSAQVSPQERRLSGMSALIVWVLVVVFRLLLKSPEKGGGRVLL